MPGHSSRNIHREPLYRLNWQPIQTLQHRSNVFVFSDTTNAAALSEEGRAAKRCHISSVTSRGCVPGFCKRQQLYLTEFAPI